MSDMRSTGFAQLVSEALGTERFVLVDVGCSSGIDRAWRVFGPNLTAFAFDPNLEEIRRLTAAETLPGIQYVGAFVGVPHDVPGFERGKERRYVDRSPWRRLSAFGAKKRLVASDPGMSIEQKTAINSWDQVPLANSDKPVILTEYLESVREIDFLKIDVDGADFTILRSILPFLLERNFLGLKIEVNFFGSDDPNSHTFHNVDRLMKASGFEIFALSMRPYSTAALPAPFQITIPAQTTWGRIFQGDAIYFRDAVAEPQAAWAARASAQKLLKLAALYSLFGLPDCAAEILLQFRERLKNVVDVRAGLDALVSDVVPEGEKLTYDEYIAQYQSDHPRFWPARATREEPRDESAERLRETQQQLDELRQRFDEIVESRSWRVTVPARRFAERLRKWARRLAHGVGRVR